MTVFRTFLKILNKCKSSIITYTVFLIFFAVFSLQTSDTSTTYEASTPDVLIINEDKETGLTKSLVEYIEKNSTIIEVKNNEEAIDDALFYRDVDYIIYIPNNFREDFLAGKNPKIQIKSTESYSSSLAQMMLERYIKVANIYLQSGLEENEIISNVNTTLEKQTNVELTSKLDTNNLLRMAFYFNFLNYSLLAGFIYVICFILSSFKNKNISKRTIISSMNYKSHNRKLLLSNGLFAIALWCFYVLLGRIMLGSIMFTEHGLIYMLNSFIFTICALTLAFLIGTIVSNKEAINGIVNVVALGSSFLCGAFVPMEFLPVSVLTVAHILPSYWYIKTNELIKAIEVFNIETLQPILINMAILLAFSLIFVVITNIISSRKRKID